MAGSDSIEYTIVRPNGVEVTRCSCPKAVLCSELKQKIAEAGGPPAAWQDLSIGDHLIPSEMPLCTSPVSPVTVVLTVQPRFPPQNGENALAFKWETLQGSDSCVEEICVSGGDERVIPSSRRIGCVGLDPDTGMLVVIGAGVEDKGKGKGKSHCPDEGKGKGKDGGKDGDASDGEGKGKGKGGGKGGDAIDDEGKGKGKGGGKDGDASDGEGKGKGKGGGKDGDASDDESKGKGKGKSSDKGGFATGDEGKGKGNDEGKGKGGGKGKQDVVTISTENTVLVVPPGSGSDPFQFELGEDTLMGSAASHCIRAAVELHVAAVAVESPVPSLGIAVALIPEQLEFHAGGKGSGLIYNGGPMTLCSFELRPAPLHRTILCEAGVDVEAVCLDRSALQLRSISAERRGAGEGRHVVFRRLRCQSSSNVLEEFCVDTAAKHRITSIAWSPASNAVLLTVAGEHAIRVFTKSSGALWQLTATFGDPARRGCQDGPASELHFWFPCADERVIEFPYDHAGKDSCPLVPGPDGAVFIYSGGALMLLSSDLQSCRKVSSMRQELWMTEKDEGTPEYPSVGNVAGVCQGKVYRRLCRTDYREEVLIRRLRISDFLRQPRSQIRRSAPLLYPGLTERRRPDAYDDEPSKLPKRYYEEDVDQWDGNPKWLGPDFQLPAADR